ncbi:hypothetical protein ACIP79_11925 [Streptomyces sp. NPDC088747]|uniref:hypothetical protein n=1 Tax=Streptomyces sp. NPDC088747 TaxID=3365886 RepID=UPI0037F669D1
MSQYTAHSTLVDEVARAVESVPGVAFLKPGLAGRLRSTVSRPERAAGGTSSAGVRMSRLSGADPWHVEIHLVALRQARTVDVARATCRAVEEYLAKTFPTEAEPAHVTVTVTDLL